MRRKARGPFLLMTACALVMASAQPSLAAPGAGDVAGATGATALTLTLNLPGGQTNRLVLTLDPVTGSASRVATTTAASARSEVLAAAIGTHTAGTGASVAMLPAPLTATTEPTGAFSQGLAASPLADLLTVRLLPATATVTAAPSSSSEAAVAGLGVGLPDAVADGLAPLLDPLAVGVNELLRTLSAQAGVPVTTLCAGLPQAVSQLGAVTSALEPALAALPVRVEVAQVLDATVLGAVCSLPAVLDDLRASLRAALATLTGPRGVLGTGLIRSDQSVTTGPEGITSRATASVAGLTLVGQQALVGAEVLRTSSTATATGRPGTADATVESSVATLAAGTVDPFVEVRATVAGVRGRLGGGTLPPALDTLLTALTGQLGGALVPLRITVLDADAAAPATRLAACPTGLDGRQTGTFEAPDGTCAAAATRGVGVGVELPAPLASALSINGPLVELQLVPSAAVARTQAAPPAAVAFVARELPRTGSDGNLLGGLGLALLAAAAVLRRRRSASPNG
ncbi:MAG: hypothetical protein JWN88_2693 [Frankiales bacterium]|jgi:LPXTG-motif cell wall-anchored protein|nr:hypothetical protein [Frankiales bacterium]